MKKLLILIAIVYSLPFFGQSEYDGKYNISFYDGKYFILYQKKITQSAYTINSLKDKIILKFTEQLNGDSIPPTTAFDVNGYTVNSLSIAADSLTLTLSLDIEYTDVLTVTYRKPITNKLQSITGRTINRFSENVFNNITSSYFNLAATGTGVGVTTLSINTSSNTTATLTGDARFYTNAAGDIGESTNWDIVSGGIRTIYLKCPIGTGKLIFNQGSKIIEFGNVSTAGWASAANAASISKNRITLLNLTKLRIDGNNTMSFNLSSIPVGVTYFLCSGSNTITGNLISIPSNSTYFACSGSNTITGNLSSLPASLITLNIQGANTITGNISSLPSTLTAIYCIGSNTITGNLSSLPSGITIFYVAGSNTISDYTSGYVWSNSINTLFMRQALGNGFTSTEVDNILIDISLATWAGSARTIDLRGVNSARTSASNAAVATLITKSVAVLTN